MPIHEGDQPEDVIDQVREHVATLRGHTNAYSWFVGKSKTSKANLRTRSSRSVNCDPCWNKMAH